MMQTRAMLHFWFNGLVNVYKVEFKYDSMKVLAEGGQGPGLFWKSWKASGAFPL